MTDSKILAWHFLPADGCLAHGDGRRVVVGETLSVDPPLVFCERGLHASSRPGRAFRYMSGFLLCRVELCGAVLQDGDKFCAEHRRVIAMADVTAALAAFIVEELMTLLDAEAADRDVAAIRTLLAEWGRNVLSVERPSDWGSQREAASRYYEKARAARVEASLAGCSGKLLDAAKGLEYSAGLVWLLYAAWPDLLECFACVLCQIGNVMHLRLGDKYAEHRAWLTRFHERLDRALESALERAGDAVAPAGDAP